MATRPIVKEFCRHIIGRGGETLKKIRTESGANVDLHRTDGTADDILLICGATASSIDSALLMVQNILEDQERRMSDRLKAEAEVKVFKESVEAEAKAASQVHVPVKSQFPPGYSGRLEKSRVGKKKQDYASSAVTLTHTPPAMSVAQSQKSSNGWQSVTNKKTRKVENPGAIPVGVAGTAVQEKTVVGAPAKLTSQKAKSAEVKPNPNQPKDAHAKIAEVKKDDSVQVANASEKTSPRMRGNVSVADTIVSIADTLVMPSSDYKIEAVKADEWQTIKKGKVVKADEDSDVKTSSKKKKKKKKAKEVDGQEVGNTATLSAQ